MDGERSIDTAIKASPLALAEQASRQAQDHAQFGKSLFELMSSICDSIGERVSPDDHEKIHGQLGRLCALSEEGQSRMRAAANQCKIVRRHCEEAKRLQVERTSIERGTDG